MACQPLVDQVDRQPKSALSLAANPSTSFALKPAVPSMCRVSEDEIGDPPQPDDGRKLLPAAAGIGGRQGRQGGGDAELVAVGESDRRVP